MTELNGKAVLERLVDSVERFGKSFSSCAEVLAIAAYAERLEAENAAMKLALAHPGNIDAQERVSHIQRRKYHD